MNKIGEGAVHNHSDEVYENKKKAMKILIEFKKYESENKLYCKQISKNTTVCCKNPEKISEYEKLYKYKNITI